MNEQWNDVELLWRSDKKTYEDRIRGEIDARLGSDTSTREIRYRTDFKQRTRMLSHSCLRPLLFSWTGVMTKEELVHLTKSMPEAMMVLFLETSLESRRCRCCYQHNVLIRNKSTMRYDHEGLMPL